MAGVNYGVDLELADQFSTTFPTASGLRNLIRALFRRWTTDPESEAGIAIYSGKCIDVRRFMAGRIDVTRTSYIAQSVARVAQHDDRVDDCTATASFAPSLKTLRIQAKVTPSTGPTFDLILATDGVTAEVLDAG